MKVASLAAQRGHKVTLFEREDALGGHLNLVRRLPARETWSRGVEYMERTLRANDVEVQLKSNPSAEDLASGGFEEIVVATGSRWDRHGLSPFRPGFAGIEGADDQSVIDVWSALDEALEDQPMIRALVERVTTTQRELALRHPDGRLVPPARRRLIRR